MIPLEEPSIEARALERSPTRTRTLALVEAPGGSSATSSLLPPVTRVSFRLPSLTSTVPPAAK